MNAFTKNFAPSPSSVKPVRTRGLFDAAAAGSSYEAFKASPKSAGNFMSIAPAQTNDSVAKRVVDLTGSDSPLMQAAKTEGLKIANSRGLLNSSLAAGATQRAMLDAALPIASQDASQAYGKNQAARAFEYSMAQQDSAQEFAGRQSALDRDFARDEAALDRTLQDSLLSKQISANEAQQIRDINFREGVAAADRALRETLQSRDIAFQTSERALDRGLQEKLASWNLASSDRNAAAQFMTNMESIYQNMYQSILNNPNLSSSARNTYFSAAKAQRDSLYGLVEQVYNVDLDWSTNSGSSAGSGGVSGYTAAAPAESPYPYTAGSAGAGGSFVG